MRHTVVAALIGICVALPSMRARPAGACSCAPPSSEVGLAEVAVVFTGEVTNQSVVRNPRPPHEPLPAWTFSVTEVFKGDVGPTVRVVSEPMICGATVPEFGAAVVFARVRAWPGEEVVLSAGLCDVLPFDPARIPASLGPGYAPQPLAAAPAPPAVGAAPGRAAALSWWPLVGAALAGAVVALAGTTLFLTWRRQRHS